MASRRSPFAHLVAGFRWWMLPVLVLVVGVALVLGVLAGMSSLAPNVYTALG